MGGCLSLAWQEWAKIGAEDWVVRSLRDGYQIPFQSSPPLSATPVNLPSYSPSSIRGKALATELAALLEKGALEKAPLTPGYYSRVFVAAKASGAWRPIIDLSRLNLHVQFTKFHMETPQSVLRSIRTGDWMVSVDLRDAYLQVPMHPESRRYLRFMSSTGIFQFKVLCFGLTTAPQVFTRVMAPVSAWMHRLGFRMVRYLDDWLIMGSSLEEVIRARDALINLCKSLNIKINLEKSNLIPAQSVTYLGMQINSQISRVFPTQKRILEFMRQLEEFMSSPLQPVQLWRSLLGRMSSLTLLVPGSRLRMRSLQLCLRSQWNFVEEEVKIEWPLSCLSDLLWWSNLSHLTPGVPLRSILPDLHLYSDASDLGWGAVLDDLSVAGVWPREIRELSINHRELLAILLALKHFSDLIRQKNVAIFCDNSTAIAYLRNAGGTKSPTLNSIAQDILRYCEISQVNLIPQFVAGRLNVIADSLSRKNQVLGAEWTLCPQVFQEVSKKWPIMVDLFATKYNHQLPLYFSPVIDPLAIGVDAMLHSWDNLLLYAFPPFGMIHQVIEKFRASSNATMTLIAPFWPQKPWFPELLELLTEIPLSLPTRRDLLRQPHFRRFHQNLHVLQLTAWRLSSNRPGISVSLGRWLNSLHSAEGGLRD